MSNKLPLISVIVPIYNVKVEYLSKCIESIMNQTLQDIEIILVDDGSESDCRNLCDKYKKMDDRIVVIHKNNEGVSKARNDGIALAKGKWIAFVDGDDWVEKNYLEELYKNINKDVDVVICDPYINFEKEQLTNKIYNKNGILSKDDIKQLQLQMISKGVCKYYPKYMSVTSVWGKIYRKDMLVKNKIKCAKHIKIAEDKLFNLYAFENAKKIFYIDVPLYHYRIHSTSVSNKYDKEVAEKYFNAILEIQNFIKLHNKDIDYVKSVDIATVLTVTNFYINNYLFNKENKTSFRQKKIEFKEFIKEFIDKEIFKNALKKIDKRYLNIAQKLTIIAIKLNSLALLKLIYVIKKLNKRKRKKIN